VFIHFIAEPGVTFDRVNLIAPGNGFEFDNFTTSTAIGISPAEVGNRLVLQKQLNEPNYVDFDANGGVGALPRQASIDGQSGNLQSSCIDFYDANRCISAPNNSYATQLTGWNTANDGSGVPYEHGASYPFTTSETLYAQWLSQFTFYNLNNPEADGSNVWDYVDWASQTSSSVTNLGEFTLPSPSLAGYHLEGWYTYDPTYNYLVRAGGPGDVVQSSTYTTWDANLFGRWLEDTTPPSVDAVAPQVLLVYPKATSVELPNMPLSGESSASICLFESDESGNQIGSNLVFTDLATASSGFSSSYSISASSALLTSTSRYIKVTVSLSSDPSCSTGNSHVVEVSPLDAELISTIEVNLTAP
jgi:hypothetical protein